MEGSGENKVLRVASAAVAAVAAEVGRVESLRRLRLFMETERGLTVRQFARQVGWPDVRAYRLVQRYEALGLLRVSHIEARAGKPLRYYVCPYRQFFIPLTLLSVQDYLNLSFAPFEAAMREQLAEAVCSGPQAVGGFLASAEEGGALSLLPVTASGELWSPLHPETPAAYFGIGPLYLSHEGARALQLELMQLLERYGQQGGPARYMYQVTLTPALERELPET